MSAYEVGDRVRVVLEGTVSDQPGYDGGIGVGSGSKRNVVYPDQSHVKSIDVLERRKPKVGDPIEGEEAHAHLPAGSLVGHKDGTLVFLRTLNGFTDSYGATYRPGDLFSPRTILHIPG